MFLWLYLVTMQSNLAMSSGQAALKGTGAQVLF